jgi:hypothetical protein
MIAPCQTNSELLPHMCAHEVSNNEAYLIIEALCVLDKILPHDSLDLFSCCNLKPMPIALPSFFLHALLFLRLALVMHIAEMSLTRCETNNQAINQYFYFLDTCIFFIPGLKYKSVQPPVVRNVCRIYNENSFTFNKSWKTNFCENMWIVSCVVEKQNFQFEWNNRE